MKSKWNLDYIKGLAGTSNDSIVDIFTNLDPRKYNYNFTDKSEMNFEIYLWNKNIIDL